MSFKLHSVASCTKYEPQHPSAAQNCPFSGKVLQRSMLPSHTFTLTPFHNDTAPATTCAASLHFFPNEFCSGREDTSALHGKLVTSNFALVCWHAQNQVKHGQGVHLHTHKQTNTFFNLLAPAPAVHCCSHDSQHFTILLINKPQSLPFLPSARH